MMFFTEAGGDERIGRTGVDKSFEVLMRVSVTYLDLVDDRLVVEFAL